MSGRVELQIKFGKNMAESRWFFEFLLALYHNFFLKATYEVIFLKVGSPPHVMCLCVYVQCNHVSRLLAQKVEQWRRNCEQERERERDLIRASAGA